MSGGSLRVDTDELRRLSRVQREILDRTAATRIGEDLDSAPEALPQMYTAGACVAAGATIDALIDEVVRDMNKQAEALNEAARRFDEADVQVSGSLTDRMNL